MFCRNSSLLSCGHVPDGLNTSLLIPIPKKNQTATDSDYRPISISTPISTIFEFVIRERMPHLGYLSRNQFGYKKNTSCKSAFFVVNETLQFYRTGGSNYHVVSLNASKAFDKLWRSGLFYKLIEWTDSSTWRLLHNYYSKSFVSVVVDGVQSGIFRTREGVKQGGILSPDLFNFFMDKLLDECMSLGVGALLGKLNTSALAYCDDFILLSSSVCDMQKLLSCCLSYAVDWKLAFNPNKSVSYSLGRSACLHLGATPIPQTDGFVYLGLPIGGDSYVEQFFREKMSKCEKALYALGSIGCKPHNLHPKAIAFVYKQYCQSIIRYGLEFIYLKKGFVNQLNVRQSILVKCVLGVKYYSRSKPLLNELSVEQIGQIYDKHKVYGLKQCMNNILTRDILEYLSKYYSISGAPKNSFVSQLGQVIRTDDIVLSNYAGILQNIDSNFACNDLELRENVRSILNGFKVLDSFCWVHQLNDVLKIIF